jgi:energy-coupling factor transport system substrate-specific component
VSWQVGAAVILALTLGTGFAWYERRRPDARVVALVAALAALAALGRIAFAALPNVKPTTDIVIIAGYALGSGPGFVVGALAGLTSNFFFGQGPWTPWQMVGWGIAGLIGAWLALAARGRRTGIATLGRWPLALACTVVGFAFTALQDVGDWVNYSDHTTAQLAVYVGKGLGFDAVHAAGCFVFALAFGPALARSLARFAARIEVTWRPPVSVAPVAILLAGAVAATTLLPGRSVGASTPTGYLLAAQNADGGLGAAAGQASSQLYSAWAAMGLASAGIDPSRTVRSGHSLTAYVESGAGSARDAGDVERTILALHASGIAGTAVNRLVGELESKLGRDGSVAQQVNLTAFAVFALRAAAVAVPARTVKWLANQQDRDGGFSFATAGGTSDVDDTAAVLEALGTSNARAVGFIEAHQNRDGGFPSNPGEDSNAQSTAWAIQGLLTAGAPAHPISRAIAFLNSLKAPDGHIRYARASDQTPVWVTAQALMALERKPLPIAPLARRIPVHRKAGAARVRPDAGRPASGRKTRGKPPRTPAATVRVSAATLRLAADAGVIVAIALAPIGL